MRTVTDSELKELEKLVDDMPLPSFKGPYPKPALTKKHAQKRAAAHLRAHKVKGHDYYYYVRGIDKEIYLGDADRILRWKELFSVQEDGNNAEH